MRALDLKLLRDLRRLWAQALAISLVVAGGVATLVMAVGSYRSPATNWSSSRAGPTRLAEY
jgi:putative ABC transport system permease protein